MLQGLRLHSVHGAPASLSLGALTRHTGQQWHLRRGVGRIPGDNVWRHSAQSWPPLRVENALMPLVLTPIGRGSRDWLWKTPDGSSSPFSRGEGGATVALGLGGRGVFDGSRGAREGSECDHPPAEVTFFRMRTGQTKPKCYYKAKSCFTAAFNI